MKLAKFVSDSCVCYWDGREEDGHKFREAAKRGERRDVVLVNEHLATGNGLTFRQATPEALADTRGGHSYFVPAQMTRGARAATREELDALPEWVLKAFAIYRQGFQ